MPPNDPDSHLATSQSRSIAYVIDMCAAATLLVPAAVVAVCLDSPSVGGFDFALVFFVYHTFFLILRGGNSPGKEINNIAVLSSAGRPLRPWQCIVRSAGLALPWVLLAIPDPELSDPIRSVLGSSNPRGLGAVWLMLELVLVAITRDRRSLTDRLAGSIVVRLPPPQPHSAPAIPMFSSNDAEFGHPPKKPPRRD